MFKKSLTSWTKVFLQCAKFKNTNWEEIESSMKKAVITFLLILAGFNLLHSQNENRKSVFVISSGCSVPYKEFAWKTMKSQAGFAAPGFNLEVDFMRYTGRYFGLSATTGYASLFFSKDEYQAHYDRILNGYGQNVVEAGNYQVLKGLVGLILKIPETRHTEALLILQLGIARSVHPDLTVTNSKLGVINSVSKNSDWNPMSNIGLKVNYWLTDKYGIGLNYNLNLTRPDFYDQTSIEKTFFLPVRYMNINAGLVMKL